MSRQKTVPGLSWATILLVALSLSIGWGVRGQWGHEYGAMIPGALAALAACLLSGREDWRRRYLYFAFFGALGWSFGGSMSYGVVLGYTASDHLPSVLYGSACLFVIGFLWGAIGGAGTALPAILDRDRLTEFFAPLCAVFIAWALAPLLLMMVLILDLVDMSGLEARLYWHDTDWIGALLAIVAVLVLALIRRRWCRASSLIMHMALGWWAGFLLLVEVFGLHMTPPRSDNWAAVLGMTVGMLVYLVRNGMLPAVYATLLTGVFAGFGFAGMNAVKLIGVSTGISTNWHSILEQSFGFVSGLGVAATMGYLSTRTPRVTDDPPVRGWTEPFSVCFVLLLITFLNIRKNVESIWLEQNIVPESIYGLSPHVWFTMAYVGIAVVTIMLVLRHRRQPLSVMPSSWLGRGQAFYLLFLWWIVIGNFARLTPFHPQRMVTEGVIHVNSLICTALILLWPKEQHAVPENPAPDYSRVIRRVALIGTIFTLVSIAVETAVIMPLFDKKQGGSHIRFGPDADFEKVTPSPP